MSINYDNDVEDLLEKSIDEKYPKIIQNLPNKCPFSFKNKQKYFNRLNKKVTKVEEKVKFNPLLLPEGWVRLFHESGMFFYCHVSTKVVTWSMPYQLQTEPHRYHRVPIRSIPCLSYKFMSNENADLESLKDINNKITEISSSDCETKKIDTTNNQESASDGIILMENKEKIIVNGSVDSSNHEEQHQLEKDIEEGEIESSDDEEEDCKNFSPIKELVLPKQYQIEPINHKSNRIKHNSMNDVKYSSPVVPAKRRKIMSSDQQCEIEKSTEINENENETTEEQKRDILDISAKLLEPDQMRNYCKQLFTFVEDARIFPKFYFVKKKIKKNNMNNINKPPVNPNDQIQPVVSNTNKEISVSPNCTEKLKIPNKNIYIDLAGRNFNCILNMYCQNAFSVTPTFKASSSLSGIHDFEVTCEISGTPYAVGEGKTKKIAKQKAVLKTLEILIPGFSNKIQVGCSEKPLAIDNNGTASTSQIVESVDKVDEEIYSIFDNMDITDPRVFSYTMKMNSMTPYNMLVECMNRHCVLDSHLISTISRINNKYNIYKLKLGDKEVQANCENKREGRQLASQYMLAKLHPHIQRWGGILRLYGPDSKPVKRFDMHEMQNLLLEDRGGVKSNLINLLRKKMLELSEEWQPTSKNYAKFKVPFENIPIIVFHPDSKEQSKPKKSFISN